MEAINEVDSILPGQVDEFEQLVPFLLRIGLLPALTMVGIILRRVKVSVHPALRAEFKNRYAVSHAPRRAEKSLDDSAALKGEMTWHGMSKWHRSGGLASDLLPMFDLTHRIWKVKRWQTAK